MAAKKKKPKQTHKKVKTSKSSAKAKAAPRRGKSKSAPARGKAKGGRGPLRSASGAKGRPVRKTKRPSAKLKRPAARKKVAVRIKENPSALALARDIAHVALEKKASDVLIIDTRQRGESVGYDYIVLGTGESDRQLGAISEGLHATLKPRGHPASSVEASPDWVLVNYDDVVAHFFSPDKRGLYDLEGLWSDAPRVPLQG